MLQCWVHVEPMKARQNIRGVTMVPRTLQHVPHNFQFIAKVKGLTQGHVNGRLGTTVNKGET